MSEDFGSVHESIRAFIADLDRKIQEQPKPHEHYELLWKGLCGDKMDDFLASRENAERYLRDSSWKLRMAALSILRVFWGPDEQLVATSHRLALEDPHPQVRGAALFGLACCYRGTNDRHVGALLARVVYDTNQPVQVREDAYEGLFDLRGIDVLDCPVTGRYRIPEDVDWVFVDSFLDEDSKRGSGVPDGRCG